jgi:hypothetical protein
MTQTLSQDIKKILVTSRHAPSSHNSQPWQVSIAGHIVTLGYVPERHLTVGDPDKRELFISLGCFIESFVSMAHILGYRVKITYTGEQPSQVARLELHQQSTGQQAVDQLDKLIEQRRSDRRFYESTKLEPAAATALQQLREGKTQFRLFTDKTTIEFLAQQTSEATYATMSNPAFRAELASWIRNNWTKQPDGMPAYTQGIPGPISLLAKFIIKKNQAVAKDQAKKDSKRVVHSAAVGLICSEQQTVAGWLDAGRLYQRACLTAQSHGVKTSGVSAAIIYPQTTQAIIKKLDLPGQPVALLRFGYTKNNPKASPRLSVHQFVVSDES